MYRRVSSLKTMQPDDASASVYHVTSG